MEFLLKEIELALENKLYFMALQSTLSLPDICGALQSSNGMANRKKYITWYNTYAKEPFDNAISGEDCYYFRCSCLHQGSTQNPNSSYKRIIFLIPNVFVSMHNNILNDALNIDIKIFCTNVIKAVRKWEQQERNNPNYIKNYDKLIKIYPNGITPYIVGMPAIS